MLHSSTAYVHDSDRSPDYRCFSSLWRLSSANADAPRWDDKSCFCAVLGAKGKGAGIEKEAGGCVLSGVWSGALPVDGSGWVWFSNMCCARSRALVDMLTLQRLAGEL